MLYAQTIESSIQIFTYYDCSALVKCSKCFVYRNYITYCYIDFNIASMECENMGNKMDPCKECAEMDRKCAQEYRNMMS